MLPPARIEDTPARGAGEQAELDQEGLDDLLDRVARLGQTGGQRLHPHGAAAIDIGDHRQIAAIHRIDPQIEVDQVARIARLRADRDQGTVDDRLAAVRAAARGTDNLLHPMREALRARATVGEVSGVLREEFGEYDKQRAAG